MKNIKLVATCLLGLEGMVSQELKMMGATQVQAENGRVIFDGTPQMIARANIKSRYSERILILMGVFESTTFDSLFENVKKIPFEEFMSIEDKFPVKGSSLNSKLKSVPDCQKIIKKAIVERMKGKYKVDWFEESGVTYQIQFLIMKDKVSIMIDTSGESLYKRGYRENSTTAPIKETLAAAMVDLSRVKSNHKVIDPMCGSGTLLIESALKAKNIASGIEREFISEKFKYVGKKVFNEEREKAIKDEIQDCEFKAYGYDIDREAIEIARENAEKAGVSDVIEFKQRDIRNFKIEEEKATIICNPPYGERLLDIESAREIYKEMGKKFKRRQGYSYTIISPDEEFEKYFGRKADKRRKLYNGMIKCQVYMYYKI